METITINYNDNNEQEISSARHVDIHTSVNAYFTYSSPDCKIVYDASGTFVEGPSHYTKQEFSNLLDAAIKTKQQYLEAFVTYLQLLRNKIKDGDLFPLEELKKLPSIAFSDFRREIEILGDAMRECLYFERNSGIDSGWISDEALITLTTAYETQFDEQLKVINALTDWEAIKYQRSHEV